MIRQGTAPNYFGPRCCPSRQSPVCNRIEATEIKRVWTVSAWRRALRGYDVRCRLNWWCSKCPLHWRHIGRSTQRQHSRPAATTLTDERPRTQCAHAALPLAPSLLCTLPAQYKTKEIFEAFRNIEHDRLIRETSPEGAIVPEVTAMLYIGMSALSCIIVYTGD